MPRGDHPHYHPDHPHPPYHHHPDHPDLIISTRCQEEMSQQVEAIQPVEDSRLLIQKFKVDNMIMMMMIMMMMMIIMMIMMMLIQKFKVDNMIMIFMI